jgi:hypothetical protein
VRVVEVQVTASVDRFVHGIRPDTAVALFRRVCRIGRVEDLTMGDLVAVDHVEEHHVVDECRWVLLRLDGHHEKVRLAYHLFAWMFIYVVFEFVWPRL